MCVGGRGGELTVGKRKVVDRQSITHNPMPVHVHHICLQTGQPGGTLTTSAKIYKCHSLLYVLPHKLIHKHRTHHQLSKLLPLWWVVSCQLAVTDSPELNRAVYPSTFCITDSQMNVCWLWTSVFFLSLKRHWQIGPPRQGSGPTPLPDIHEVHVNTIS